MNGGLNDAKRTCRAFCQAIYRAVYSDAKKCILEYGCIHDKGPEMAEQNVLIEFNRNQVGPSLFFLWVRIGGLIYW